MTVPPQHPPVPPTGGQPAPTGQPVAWPQGPAQPAAWPQGQGQPGAWPPPAPVPVVKQIPEGQPYTVRASVRKRVLQFGLLGLFILLMMSCPIGLSGVSGGDLPTLLLMVGFFVLLFGGIFALQIYLIASGGPVLAVGPDGLWIKTRPTRGQAVLLPWGAIEQIYTRRWVFDKVVCVKARDPRTGGNLGAFTALDSGMQQLVFGTGFTAPLTFADRPEREIMGAIVHYSAGRTFIR